MLRDSYWLVADNNIKLILPDGSCVDENWKGNEKGGKGRIRFLMRQADKAAFSFAPQAWLALLQRKCFVVDLLVNLDVCLF